MLLKALVKILIPDSMANLAITNFQGWPTGTCRDCAITACDNEMQLLCRLAGMCNLSVLMCSHSSNSHIRKSFFFYFQGIGLKLQFYRCVGGKLNKCNEEVQVILRIVRFPSLLTKY